MTRPEYHHGPSREEAYANDEQVLVYLCASGIEGAIKALTVDRIAHVFIDESRKVIRMLEERGLLPLPGRNTRRRMGVDWTTG